MNVITLPPPRPRARRRPVPRTLADAVVAAERAADALRQAEYACAVAGLRVCAGLPQQILALAGQFDTLAAEIAAEGDIP